MKYLDKEKLTCSYTFQYKSRAKGNGGHIFTRSDCKFGNGWCESVDRCDIPRSISCLHRDLMKTLNICAQVVLSSGLKEHQIINLKARIA